MSSSCANAASVDYPPRKTYPDDAYPQYRSLAEVIEQWPPDDANVPEHFHETIQIFNYSNLDERQMALSYREAELPFKLYDIPDIEEVVALWTDEYLTKQMAYDKTINVEVSINSYTSIYNFFFMNIVVFVSLSLPSIP